MRDWIRLQLRPLLFSFVVVTILTGIVYPLTLAGLVTPLFPGQAGGSIVEIDDVVAGSSLIGQAFQAPRYFHSRPSANNYDAATSGGTNLGPNNPKLQWGDKDFPGVRELAEHYRRENDLPASTPLPVDAVTRSGSGLDPHISPANADLQVRRIARERGLDGEAVRGLVAAHTHGPQLGFLGDPRVDVLALNLALDRGETAVAAESFYLPAKLRRWLEYAAFLAVVLLFAHPMALYLLAVFEQRPAALDRFMRPVERLLCRLIGIGADAEMSAGMYALNFTIFSLLGTAYLFALFVIQRSLPGGPEDRHLTTPMTAELAANTAISFATTTTWQAYGGETTLRYVVQMVGLAAQGFLAGAAGLAVGMAFLRGFSRENAAAVGNFWVDMLRAVLWVLLPGALVLGIALVWQGVPLNMSPYVEATTREGVTQTIAQGPAAALEPIKNLGTNGGGFFAANGAHPYANPSPLTNFLGLLAMTVLPAAMPIALGRRIGRPRAGWMLLGVMVVLFVAGLAICDAAEAAEPVYAAGLNVVGGNMEGKEVRFGIGSSVLTAVVTSNTATGSNNSMHSSYQPMGVLVLLFNMLIGEVVFGGLGSGLYGMVMAALIAGFLGGLMVGRTPDYVGKAIGIGEAKLLALYTLLTPLVVLPLTAIAAGTDAGRAGLTTNGGARGFAEMIFAFASCQANNGQAMGGLDANNLFYNLMTAVAMLVGRLGPGVLALLLAGRFAAQGRRAEGSGSLSGESATFAVLVLGTILLLGALCFLPALALGPVAEQLAAGG